MTDSTEAIRSAKQFALSLTTNTKLLNAFLAVERKLIAPGKLDENFKSTVLDNFIADHGYNCTIEQANEYGMPILSTLSHWAGTYYTQISPEKGTNWTNGPTITISHGGKLSVDKINITQFGFNTLNLRFQNNSLVFYMSSPSAFEDHSVGKSPASPKGNGHPRVKAFFGSYNGMKIIGTAQKKSSVKKSSKKTDSFVSTFNIVLKHLNQVILAYQVYHFVKKGTQWAANLKAAKSAKAQAQSDLDDAVSNTDKTAEEIGNLNNKISNLDDEIGNLTSEQSDLAGEFSQGTTYITESQGEVATMQYQQIDQVLSENPGMTMEEASNELRDIQSSELETEQVENVSEELLNPMGDAIADTALDTAGTELSEAALEAGAASATDLVVDTFLEEAIFIVLI